MDARRSPQSGNRPGKVRLVPREKWFSDSTLHFRHSFSSLARWFRRGGSLSQGRAGRVWTPAPRGGRPVRRPCGEASGTLVVPTPSCPLSPRGVTGLPFMYVKCFHFQELRKLMHPMCKKDSDLFDDVVLLSSATLLATAPSLLRDFSFIPSLTPSRNQTCRQVSTQIPESSRRF